MKKITVLVFISIGIMSCQMNRNQTPYLSTTLCPYSEELGFVPSYVFQIETYAKLETGLDDIQIYTGIGEKDNISSYWIRIKSILGSSFTTIRLQKDESLNICRDTVKYKFSGDSTMIAFEMIHHLSTNEIQYIWLDGDNNRSDQAILISLDHPLKEGKLFPDLTVERLNGEQLSFHGFVGKTVVVNWWFVGCPPCMDEIPGLNKLVEQYKGNPNVVFIAIANSTKEEVTLFLKNNEFNYIQTLANNEARKLLGGAYPVNLIINSEGKIYSFSKGAHVDKYLEMEKILKELH